MAIEKKIIIEAVRECSKNSLLSADEACISNYICDHYGEDGWDADTLNADLSHLVTDAGVLDQNDDARYTIHGEITHE